MKINIALLPHKADWMQLIQLSQQLNKDDLQPHIQLGKGSIPHLSLVHSDLERSKLEALAHSVNSEISKVHEIVIETKAIEETATKKGIFISLSFQNFKKLQFLHTRLMDITNSFERVASIYRQNCAYENYFPHITLAHEINSPSPKLPFDDILFDRLVIGDRRDYGTLHAIFYEWTLQ